MTRLLNELPLKDQVEQGDQYLVWDGNEPDPELATKRTNRIPIPIGAITSSYLADGVFSENKVGDDAISPAKLKVDVDPSNSQVLSYMNSEFLWVDPSTFSISNEQIDDRVADLLEAGDNITLTYDDVANTLTITANDTGLTATEVDGRVVSLLRAGSNIQLVHDSAQNTLTINSSSIGLTAPQVRNEVANLLQAGTNINLNYDQNANTLRISSTASMGEGLTSEQVRDITAAFIRPGNNINIVHDDAGNTLTFSVDGDGVTIAEVDQRISTLLTAGENITLNYDANTQQLIISATDSGLTEVFADNQTITGDGSEAFPFRVLVPFTLEERAKLARLGNKVQANWLEPDITSDAYIQNKPDIPAEYTDADVDERIRQANKLDDNLRNVTALSDTQSRDFRNAIGLEDWTAVTGPLIPADRVEGVPTWVFDPNVRVPDSKVDLDIAVRTSNKLDTDLTNVATLTPEEQLAFRTAIQAAHDDPDEAASIIGKSGFSDVMTDIIDVNEFPVIDQDRGYSNAIITNISPNINAEWMMIQISNQSIPTPTADYRFISMDQWLRLPSVSEDTIPTNDNSITLTYGDVDTDTDSGFDETSALFIMRHKVPNTIDHRLTWCLAFGNVVPSEIRVVTFRSNPATIELVSELPDRSATSSALVYLGNDAYVFDQAWQDTSFFGMPSTVKKIDSFGILRTTDVPNTDVDEIAGVYACVDNTLYLGTSPTEGSATDTSNRAFSAWNLTWAEQTVTIDGTTTTISPSAVSFDDNNLQGLYASNTTRRIYEQTTNAITVNDIGAMPATGTMTGFSYRGGQIYVGIGSTIYNIDIDDLKAGRDWNETFIRGDFDIQGIAVNDHRELYVAERLTNKLYIVIEKSLFAVSPSPVEGNFRRGEPNSTTAVPISAITFDEDNNFWIAPDFTDTTITQGEIINLSEDYHTPGAPVTSNVHKAGFYQFNRGEWRPYSVIDTDGGSGTNVVANPAGTSGRILNRITIDGDNYNIPRGTDDYDELDNIPIENETALPSDATLTADDLGTRYQTPDGKQFLVISQTHHPADRMVTFADYENNKYLGAYYDGNAIPGSLYVDANIGKFILEQQNGGYFVRIDPQLRNEGVSPQDFDSDWVEFAATEAIARQQTDDNLAVGKIYGIGTGHSLKLRIVTAFTAAVTEPYDTYHIIPTDNQPHNVYDESKNILDAGSNITITPNDNNNTLTIAATVPAGFTRNDVENWFNDALSLSMVGNSTGLVTQLSSDQHSLSVTVDPQELGNILGYITGDNEYYLKKTANGQVEWAEVVQATSGLTGEQVDDRVDGLLQAGGGITLTYDDTANTLTITRDDITPSDLAPGGAENAVLTRTTTGMAWQLSGVSQDARFYFPNASGQLDTPTADDWDNDNALSKAIGYLGADDLYKVKRTTVPGMTPHATVVLVNDDTEITTSGTAYRWRGPHSHESYVRDVQNDDFYYNTSFGGFRVRRSGSWADASPLDVLPSWIGNYSTEEEMRDHVGALGQYGIVGNHLFVSNSYTAGQPGQFSYSWVQFQKPVVDVGIAFVSELPDPDQVLRTDYLKLWVKHDGNNIPESVSHLIRTEPHTFRFVANRHPDFPAIIGFRTAGDDDLFGSAQGNRNVIGLYEHVHPDNSSRRALRLEVQTGGPIPTGGSRAARIINVFYRELGTTRWKQRAIQGAGTVEHYDTLGVPQSGPDTHTIAPSDLVFEINKEYEVVVSSQNVVTGTNSWHDSLPSWNFYTFYQNGVKFVVMPDADELDHARVQINQLVGSQANLPGWVTSGLIPTDKLGSDTANSNTFLRGDQTWALPPRAVEDITSMDYDASQRQIITNFRYTHGNPQLGTHKTPALPNMVTDVTVPGSVDTRTLPITISKATGNDITRNVIMPNVATTIRDLTYEPTNRNLTLALNQLSGGAPSQDTVQLPNYAVITQIEPWARMGNTATIPVSKVTAFGEAVDDQVNTLLHAGENVTLTYDDVNDRLTISATDSGLTGEQVDDRVGQLLVAGANISLDYNDTVDRLTISATTPGLDGEAVDDRVDQLLTAGANINLTYDDTAGTLTIAAEVPDGVVTSDDIDNITYLTQAEYDALATVDAETEYNITDAPDVDALATGHLINETLGHVATETTLPVNDRVWVGTGITVPDGVSVILVDTSDASDDFHVIDWAKVLGHQAATVGADSETPAGQFETFYTHFGLVETLIRIGHDGNGQVLLASDNIAQAATLPHIYIEILKAPILPSGVPDIVADRFLKGNAAGDALVFGGIDADDVTTGIFSLSRIPNINIGRISAGGGTSGDILTNNGTGNAVTWETPDWLNRENVQDAVNGFLVAGTNIRKTYDDTNNSLRLDVDNEYIDDRVNDLLVAGNNITLTYNDANGTLTIASTATATPGATDFTDHTDTPSSYADNAGKILIVNAAEDALEFVENQAEGFRPLGPAEVAVSADGNDITLTPTEAITGYQDTRVWEFRVERNNQGAVTVNISGQGAKALQKSNNAGTGLMDLEAQDIIAGSSILISENSGNNPFILMTGVWGNASRRNVGTNQHQVPVLGANGILASGRLAAGGSDGQVLTRTATGQAWEDTWGLEQTVDGVWNALRGTEGILLSYDDNAGRITVSQREDPLVLDDDGFFIWDDDNATVTIRNVNAAYNSEGARIKFKWFDNPQGPDGNQVQFRFGTTTDPQVPVRWIGDASDPSAFMHSDIVRYAFYTFERKSDHWLMIGHEYPQAAEDDGGGGGQAYTAFMIRDLGDVSASTDGDNYFNLRGFWSDRVTIENGSITEEFGTTTLIERSDLANRLKFRVAGVYKITISGILQPDASGALRARFELETYDDGTDTSGSRIHLLGANDLRISSAVDGDEIPLNYTYLGHWDADNEFDLLANKHSTSVAFSIHDASILIEKVA